MPFRSVLFLNPEDAHKEARSEPEFFRDLNLDQIVSAITESWQEADLAPFFYTRLRDLDAITYRHEVLRDLEQPSVMTAITAFGDGMKSVRQHLDRAKKLHYAQEKQRWFLAAVETYCATVSRVRDDLECGDVRSRGLSQFVAYLRSYMASATFTALLEEATRLADALASIKYTLFIRGRSVTVARYDGEPDYSQAVERTFENFRRGAVRDYRVRFHTELELDHVEAQIVDRVALLFPEVFDALAAFRANHAAFMDDVVSRFDREVKFYVAFLAHIEPLASAGLPFCYPRVSDRSKELSGADVFDLALAGKLVPAHTPVVTNSFSLSDTERIFVVSGPNHGGKTTFARTFGQLHYLAALGCLVPGSDAGLFLFDELFTHFERVEHLETLRGKLQDDLVRIRHIFDRATANSVVVINEIFASTTADDAVALARRVLDRLSELDVLGVCVTFLAELAAHNAKTVSLVSTVDPVDPAIRTYKLERRPADRLAYAVAIARKHRVTYERLKERIKT